MAIKVGTVFRVNEINFRYQIDCQENSTKSHDELLELSKNMLYVVTGFNDTDDMGVRYPISAEIHPMFRHLVEDGVFYSRFNEREMEVLDEQEPY